MKICQLSVISGLLILIACASTPNTHFYIIDLPSEKSATNSYRYPVSIVIERLQAEAPYADDRIIFRDSVYEVKFYHYHRWVVPPAEMITNKMYEKIKSANLFQNVNRMSGNMLPDYQLSGRLTALEEWDEAQQWYGQVQLSLALTKHETNEIVWQKDFTSRVPSTQQKPMAVVKALSTGLDNCLNNVIAELELFLKNEDKD